MIHRLHLDYETWSSVAIRRGTDVYLNNAKPLLVTYALDNDPVRVHDFTVDGFDYSWDLFEMLHDPSVELWAHNVFFDRMVTDKLLGIKTDIFRWRCSMAQALAHGLPGGLGPLCEVLGVPLDLAKIDDGKRLIRKFCCGKQMVKDEEWQLFIDYAVSDITAMRECMKRMPNWNYQGEELRLWHIDQIINNRGFAVDVKLAEKAIEMLKEEKERLDNATWIATCGSVTAATQRDKLLLYLCEAQGCVLRDLRASTIEDALADESLEEPTKALLRIRLEAAKTSTSKYKRMLESIGKGNRLRGTLQYSGAARTARWAGRIFQPQNLPRPTMLVSSKDGSDPNCEIRTCVELIRSGYADLVTLFGSKSEVASNVLRGLIIAAEGGQIYISDYSAIEGRVNAWLAGEDWKITAFKDKKDLYILGYEKAFGLPPGTLKKGDARRQLGKVMELALGYQGGVGAFINLALGYGMDLEELGRIVQLDEKSLDNWVRAIGDDRTYGLTESVYRACDTLKNGYRKANLSIVSFWYQLQDAAVTVIEQRDPTLKMNVGPIQFDCNKTWMRIKLPSGRFLCYALPKIHKDGQISYMSWRNKRWVRTKTYGGKLCENIVQAVSRDLLAYALLLMYDNGFPVVLHVHDEVIADVLTSLGKTFEEFHRLMKTKPRWAVGLPFDAESWYGVRYEKR